MTTVALLVPRRADRGRRDDVWSFARSNWSTHMPEYSIVEGHDDGDHRFNRSAAINAAAVRAGDADVFAIIDSDVLISAEQVRRGVMLAQRRQSIVFPFEHFAYLDRRMTDAVMNGYDGSWEVGVQFRMGGTCSSVVIVPRPLFEKVHGFDPSFEGWGWEDVAFSLACQTLGNGFDRVKGDVWHLWHPKPAGQGEGSPSFAVNTKIAQRYVEASGDPAAMQAIVDER